MSSGNAPRWERGGWLAGQPFYFKFLFRARARKQTHLLFLLSPLHLPPFLSFRHQNYTAIAMSSPAATAATPLTTEDVLDEIERLDQNITRTMQEIGNLLHQQRLSLTRVLLVVE